jgi:hypothetical protein
MPIRVVVRWPEYKRCVPAWTLCDHMRPFRSPFAITSEHTGETLVEGWNPCRRPFARLAWRLAAATNRCTLACCSRTFANLLLGGACEVHCGGVPTRVEVTRVATDGHRNACSLLYAAAWQAAKALGYRRLITYTQKVLGFAISEVLDAHELE